MPHFPGSCPKPGACNLVGYCLSKLTFYDGRTMYIYIFFCFTHKTNEVYRKSKTESQKTTESFTYTTKGHMLKIKYCSRTAVLQRTKVNI